MTETQIFITACVALVAMIAGVRAWRMNRREAIVVQKFEAAKRAGASLPPTLHPVIDYGRCISSGSCTTACPQGEHVLGFMEGRPVLVNPNMCIGHGRCAAECPQGAIRLVFGTHERGVDIPFIDPNFQTNVPGIYIAGELGGMGLVANAVRQAGQAMGHIDSEIRSDNGVKAVDGLVDVVIVGAGPAGLSAALWAIEHKLTYRLVEKESAFGGSILHYPRKKLVMSEPVRLPMMGTLLPKTLIKEELLDLWRRAVKEHNVKIEHGVDVADIKKAWDGTFKVTTNQGEFNARKVLLCIGRRGMPRKLGVPGEEAENVAYSLHHPEQYDGRRVVVVGGGDSALEAACTIAEETTGKVALSYRGGSINRAKQANVERLNRLVSEGKLEALWKTELAEIAVDHIKLKSGTDLITRPNDDVLIFAGGTLPVEFLARAGVRMEKHHGEEVAFSEQPSTSTDVFKRIQEQQQQKGLANKMDESETFARKAFRMGLIVTALTLVTGLLWVGGEYYFAPAQIKEANKDLAIYAPSGLWGQSVGVLALIFMITNFMYYIRKEFTFMKGMGSIHLWMQVHVFSGLLTGIVALIHSCFFARNIFATALYLSLGIVVLTGIIGRYIYSFVPLDPRGRPLAHNALVNLNERMAKDFGRLYEKFEVASQAQHILDADKAVSTSVMGMIFRIVVHWPRRYWQIRRLLWKAARDIQDPAQLEEFSHFCRSMLKLRFQMDYLGPLKQLLGLWRSSHAILAVFLMILVTVHAVIEYWVGYRWIF